MRNIKGYLIAGLPFVAGLTVGPAIGKIVGQKINPTLGWIIGIGIAAAGIGWGLSLSNGPSFADAPTPAPAPTA